MKKFKRALLKALGPTLSHQISVLQVRLLIAYHRAHRFGARQTESPYYNLRIHRLASETGQTWFGYFDKTPFSTKNDRILAMVGPSKNRSPKPKEKVKIGFFNWPDSIGFQKLGETSMWCWQQGCRLRWMEALDDDFVIYNREVDGNYGTVIQNARSSSIEHVLRVPLYDVDIKGRWAITLNFSRLERLRPGYGYKTREDITQSVSCPDDDGVWRVNLISGEKQLLISLSQLASVAPELTMSGADHYVNHLQFNPSGTRFVFLHLWVRNGHRYGRAVTSDLSGKSTYFFSHKISMPHFTWLSDEYLLASASLGFPNYRLFHDGSGKYQIIGEGKLTVDGHPSYHPDGKTILTDTYPDVYGEQHLLLYREDLGLIDLMQFYSPPAYRWETRCDLHPRWDRTGKFACIDSAKRGRRAMYVISLDSILSSL